MKIVRNFILVVATTGVLYSAAPAAPEPQLAKRADVPQADAGTFGFGSGIYGNQGVLGGHLQLGFASSFRLGGAIYGTLLGDQAGTFSTSNYWFGWLFSGHMMFISSETYKNLFRPYTILELTYAYDAKYKGSNVLGALKIGTEITLTSGYGIFIDAGVIAPFQRDATTPAIAGGIVNVGVNLYF